MNNNSIKENEKMKSEESQFYKFIKDIYIYIQEKLKKTPKQQIKTKQILIDQNILEHFISNISEIEN